MNLLADKLVGRRVSVYCAHTVATGLLQSANAQGVGLEDARFRMRTFHPPARGEEAGAVWSLPWAIIPWATIDYIGPAEAE